MNTTVSSATPAQATQLARSHKGLVVGLWIVGIYFIWTSLGSLVSYAVLYTGVVELTQDQANHVASLSPLFVGFSALLMGLNLVSGVLLLRRYRIAFHILVTSAAFNALALVINVWRAGGLAPGVSAAQAFIPYVVLTLILAFTFLLLRKGVLWR
jgi:hypothetical protein